MASIRRYGNFVKKKVSLIFLKLWLLIDFALRSKSHGPLSESRVLRRLEKLNFSYGKKKKDRDTPVVF